MAKIKGQNLTITSHTRVCSRHFLSTDLIEPTNPDGRRRLKTGTVPVLFQWNDFTVPSAAGTDDLQGTEKRDTDTTETENRLVDVQYPDHDNCPNSEATPSSHVSLTMGMDESGPQSSDTDNSTDDSCTTTVSTLKPEGMSKKSIKSCADVGCSNSSGKLQIWKQTQCDMHKPLLHEQCPCLRPYSLHAFPGRAQDEGVRQEWIRNINREDFVPKINSTLPTRECLQPLTVNMSCVEPEVITVKVEADYTNVKSESDHEDQPITPTEDGSSQLGAHISPKSPQECGLRDELKKETNLKPPTCDQTVQTNIEQDCDEYYFMNLVKTFKKLPPQKKTEVRMKIERILFEAEFE